MVRRRGVAFGDGFLHRLHARPVEVEQVVERFLVAQDRGGGCGGRADRQRGAKGHQDSFHFSYFRLYFFPLIFTCNRSPRQAASTRCAAASPAGSSTVTSRHGLVVPFPHRECVGRTFRALAVGARHPPLAAFHPLRPEDFQHEVVAVAEAGRCGARGEILRRVALHEVVVQGHFALGRSESLVGDDEEPPGSTNHTVRRWVRPS